MPEHSKNTPEQLREFADILESRLTTERNALQMVRIPRTSTTTETDLDFARRIEEPIVRAIVAYEGVQRDLYRLFPDLERKEHST